MTDGIQFTYDTYEGLLRRLKRNDYTFGDYEASGDRTVILRHDVDWSPQKALRMAELEADLGISATYFFLLTSPLYNALYEEDRTCIEKIAALGHDVGLHFSTHQYWTKEPRVETIVTAIRRERRILSEAFDDIIEAVSFHIPPDWILRRRFDEFTSTYEPRFFEDIAYRGDSNQRWREDHPLEPTISDRVQILVHPGLWGEDDATFEERLVTEQNRRFGDITDFTRFQFINEGLS